MEILTERRVGEQVALFVFTHALKERQGK